MHLARLIDLPRLKDSIKNLASREVQEPTEYWLVPYRYTFFNDKYMFVGGAACWNKVYACIAQVTVPADYLEAVKRFYVLPIPHEPGDW